MNYNYRAPKFDEQMSLPKLYKIVKKENTLLNETGMKSPHRLFISAETITKVKKIIQLQNSSFDFAKIEKRYNQFKATATFPNGRKKEGYNIPLPPKRIDEFPLVQSKPPQVKIAYHIIPIPKQSTKLTAIEKKNKTIYANGNIYHTTHSSLKDLSKLTRTIDETSLLQKTKEILLEKIIEIHTSETFKNTEPKFEEINDKNKLITSYVQGKEFSIQLAHANKNRFKIISIYQ